MNPETGPLDYEHVAPLVAHAEPRYTSLYVTFRCPETGAEVVSTARIAERTPIGGDLRHGGDFRRFLDALKSQVPAFPKGGGPPPTGAEEIEKRIREKPDVETLPPAVYQHAVVRAFEPVRHRFRWDPEKGRYVGVQ